MDTRNKIQFFPKELVHEIGSYLSYNDCKQLSICSRHLFFNTLNREYFDKRPDQSIDHIIKLLPNIIKGIEYYLSKINRTTREGITRHPDDDYYVVYDKGSNRAAWFLEIMKSKNITNAFRILSLSALLNEANGKQLKSIVKNEIKNELAGKYIPPIRNILLLQCYPQFSCKQITLIENSLLERIHQSPLKIFQNGGYAYDRDSDEFPFVIAINSGNFENEIIEDTFKEKKSNECFMM